MSKVLFKKGSSEDLEKQGKKDGLLSFTIDDGKIHLDYKDENGILQRMTFYSGKLTIGDQVFDGSQDVTVSVYKGETVYN